MKPTTFILAAFILLLAVKPGMDWLSLQAGTEQTCCGGQCTPISDNDKSQDQNQENGCDGQTCNPFQVCGSCVLMCSNICSFIFDLNSTALSDKRITYLSTITSQFASDFWQPPKIV